MNAFDLNSLCKTHRIDEAEHSAFAAFTADHNPMHIDPLYARKTQAGRPVVHGMHILVWALDVISSSTTFNSDNLQISCDFKKFIFVGDEFTLEYIQEKKRKHIFIVRSNSIDSLKIVLSNSEPSKNNLTLQDSKDHSTDLHVHALFPIIAKPENSYKFCETYDFSSQCKKFLIKFPSIVEAIGTDATLAFCMTSTVVGMRCPGLHSIYSGLEIIVSLDKKIDENWMMNVAADSYDERFGLLVLNVNTRKINGKLKTFYRQAPVETPSTLSMRSIVNRNLDNKNVLIIGGSRGLGEALVKLAYLSGANVFFTYFKGELEAQAILDDALGSSVASGNVSAFRFDVHDDYGEQLDGLSICWDYVFYLATPKIFVQKSKLFDTKLFQTFNECYVDRFYALVEYLVSLKKRNATQIYYPSSIAIEDRPEEMTEYAMSKNAAEILISDFNRSNRSQVRIVTSRLPRFESDQTATVVKADAETSIAVANNIFELLSVGICLPEFEKMTA